jgi:hypothetical protein
VDKFTESLLSPDDESEKGPIKPKILSAALPPRSDTDRILDALHSLHLDARNIREELEASRELQKKQLHWQRVAGFVIWVSFVLFTLFGIKIIFR